MSFPSVLAIVPARKGSKRIPGKNVRDFLGKPLICWTLEAALQVACLTKVVVTTNDEAVLGMESDYGRVAFVKRPEELSGDDVAGTLPVVHVMQLEQKKYDYVMLLQPTSPLRKPYHIEQAFGQVRASEADSLVSARESFENMGHVVVKNGRDVVFLSEELHGAKPWVLNGAIYIAKWDHFLKEKTFIGKNTEIFGMPANSSVDIDTESDWNQALLYAEGRM